MNDLQEAMVGDDCPTSTSTVNTNRIISYQEQKFLDLSKTRDLRKAVNVEPRRVSKNTDRHQTLVVVQKMKGD